MQSLVDLRMLLGTVSSKQYFSPPSSLKAFQNKNQVLFSFMSFSDAEGPKKLSLLKFLCVLASPSEPETGVFLSLYVFSRARGSPKDHEAFQKTPKRAWASPRCDFARVFQRFRKPEQDFPWVFKCFCEPGNDFAPVFICFCMPKKRFR